MSSFSFDFPDIEVFNALGDDIKVTPKDGESVMIKAPFYLVHMAEELDDRFDVDYPHLKDVMEKDLHLFKDGTVVEVNGVTYSYQNRHPNSATTFEIELRTLIETW